MKGLKEIYGFTLKHLLGAGVVKATTIIFALILFALPAILIPASADSDTPGEEMTEPEPGRPSGPAEDQYNAEGVGKVYVVSEGLPLLSGEVLAEKKLSGYETASFAGASSRKEAEQKAAGEAGALILVFTETEEGLSIRGIVPEDSVLDVDKALFLADTAAKELPRLLGGETVTAPLSLEFTDAEEAQPADPEKARGEELRGILTMVLPYLNIMVIYFLVLYYGQSAANSVILEKTSKLMDTFLVSVKPETMIFGKVLAAWTAALLQVFIWIASLLLGCGAGILIAKASSPESVSGVLRLVSLLREATGMFSLPAALVALSLLVGGFLLYCCMAAIGASFASKPEELSASISVFTILLVVSMFVTLRAGFLEGEMAAGVKWFDIFPFTAILITPARVLLGYVSDGFTRPCRSTRAISRSFRISPPCSGSRAYSTPSITRRSRTKVTSTAAASSVKPGLKRGFAPSEDSSARPERRSAVATGL